MKKLVLFVLMAALCASLCSCASSPESAPGNTTTSNVAAMSEKAEGPLMQLGEEFAVSSATMKFTDTRIAFSIGEGVRMVAREGMPFFGIIGTIKNTGGKNLSVDNIKAELVFNDEFVYTAKVIIAEKRDTNDNFVAPLAEEKVWLYASVPEALMEVMSDCEVRFSVNDNFESLPETVDSGAYTIRLAIDEEICKATINTRYVATDFFAECPVLPTPENYIPVWQFSSYIGTEYASYSYLYVSERDNAGKDFYNTYVTQLREFGYTIKAISEIDCEVFSGNTKVAQVYRESEQIRVKIPAGVEKLEAPGADNLSDVGASGAVEIELGAPIETDYVYMVLNNYKTAVELESDTDSSGTYRYYSSESGNPFFYLTGIFKNLGGAPVDIWNIFVTFTFDDTYTYRGGVYGFVDNAGKFVRDITPLTSVNCYVYTEVPQDLIDNFETCVVKIGFRKDFGNKVIDGNTDLPLFEKCDDVFDVRVVKN